MREISFIKKSADPLKCVLAFKKIANKYNECIPNDSSPVFHNGVYTYYKGAFSGFVQVYDMNSAYLWALSQPLADVSTKTPCSIKDVYNKKFDYFSFENELHRIMFYKNQIEEMQAASLWIDVKIYGYKSKVFFAKTAAELYKLKSINKEFYKNVANLTVGCMHKRSGKNNSATLAASLYAFFQYYISNLVALLKKNNYNVIMVTTDSVKIAGVYNKNDNILKIGNNLGEFKLEYEGNATYYTIGHYEENNIKWKGKPQYIRDGCKPCKFIENIKNEREVYIKYAEL